MLDSCRLITLPRIDDPRGSLSFVEGERHIPFAIKRVFYIYDVPQDIERGGHAHKECHQFLICLNGSIHVLLDDGREKNEVRLDSPCRGLYIAPCVWGGQSQFTPGSVLVVLTSHLYDPDDYLRDYDAFLEYIQRHKG